MSRIWLNNGRAVLADGMVVLCDECPCGCRKFYYVDHSLSTSGDGHSWDTAFNNVNDAIDSQEVINYLVADCAITVYVRGDITYHLIFTRGVSIYQWMRFVPETGRLNFTESMYWPPYPYPSPGSLYVEFINFDFAIADEYFQNVDHVRYINCTFTLNYTVPATYSYNTAKFRTGASYVYMTGCTFNLNYNYNGTYSGIGYQPTPGYLYSGCSRCEFKNIVININFNVHFTDGGRQGYAFNVFDTMTQSLFENVTININMTGSLNWIEARPFRYKFNDCIFDTCSAVYALSKDETGSQYFYSYACTFSITWDAGKAPTFYDSARYCSYVNESDPDETYCDDNCPVI